MKPKSRFIKGILLSLVLVILLNTTLTFGLGTKGILAPMHAYAEEENGEGTEGGGGEALAGGNPSTPEETPETTMSTAEFIAEVASKANRAHRFFAPLVNVFSFHIGNFLGTDFVYEGQMGMMLQKIWVISRNMVNIAFVFILLWLALNTIFNPGFPLDELKKKLLIFALLLIGVNFSWLATKVVLDASNVVTHAVFAIPSGITAPPSSPCEINGVEDPVRGSCYPTVIIAPVDTGITKPLVFAANSAVKDDNNKCDKMIELYDKAYEKDNQGNYTVRKSTIDNPDVDVRGRMGICMENLNLINYNQNTAVIYLTYGMARIQNLVTSIGSQKIDDLVVSVIMSLVIQLAYTLSLLALFIALVIRTAMLWFFVAFSPFLVLVIWFKGKEDVAMGEFKFGYNEFINWAFVPAKVGAVFVVSFIMISTGQAAGDAGSRLVDNINSSTGVDFQIPEISTIFNGIGSLYQFVWLLMSLVILWMGVFGILGEMAIVKSVTNKIGDYGKELGGLVATLPYKAPIMGLGKGGAPASIKDTLGALDLRSTIRDYTGENTKPEDVKTMNREANSRRAKDQIKVAIDRGGILTAPQAKTFAQAFGLELSRFNAQDRKARMAALKTAGASESDAGRFIDELEKHSKATEVSTKPLQKVIPQQNEDVSATPPAGSPPATPPAGPPSAGPPSGA